MTFQGILLFLLFLDTFCIQKILSFLLFPDTFGKGWKVRMLVGWKVRRLEGWKAGRLKCWRVGPLEAVSRHFPYLRDFVVSAVSRHFWKRLEG